ncbi:hypothetical protein RFM26_24525 [Mesorhizobium sp. VK23B]|uniref:DUF982 domain-containing protein n=1 Tax=Mesorhizobium dulcispinae TaxID=3072316 RepID=A0ABU4XKR4_9HYPH|nr:MULTISPECIES: hypothetical protein [unclassified Mesorhizobium]MDX8468878.1 hypothetical protein [Mesorhizobium sp. VK23B]MDX8475333.1 hypothetical protein [Mesorhizobium sp. VK23A]
MVLSNILNPEDVAILVAVLDDYCRKFHIRMESDERLEAARCALILFENGCRDPVILSERLTARIRQSPEPAGTCLAGP